MRREIWDIWIENKKLLDRYLESCSKKRLVRKGATRLEVFGHLNKAKRNLRFSRGVIDEFKDYYEWAITSFYYAVYQAALSLCANKDFKTKSHLATLAILIRFYYPKFLNKNDIKMIAEIGLEEKDIKDFVELKEYREEATYSISVNYEKNLAEEIGKKAIGFVNKIDRIISEQQNL